MPIIVNLDVMMAKRKISLGELADKPDSCQSFHFENREGKGRAFFHLGSYLQGTRLQTGRYSGI